MRRAFYFEQLTSNSAPTGSACVLGLVIFLPNTFPHHHRSRDASVEARTTCSRNQFLRLDPIGATLLLCASVLLVISLEQGGNSYSWRSPFIIICFSLCGICWLCFFAWSRFATDREDMEGPVFPWRLVQTRYCLGMLL